MSRFNLSALAVRERAVTLFLISCLARLDIAIIRKGYGIILPVIPNGLRSDRSA
jgi:hypothetical protein